MDNRGMRIFGLTSPPVIAGRLNADFDDLDDFLLVNILEFLPINEIMCNRRVSKKWGEVIKMVVPPGDCCVNMKKYNAMRVMTTALPNLQQITLSHLYENGSGRHQNWHKYSDGEDPNEEQAARTDGMTAHDIEIISNFRKMRVLTIQDSLYYLSLLNGSYPFLFNSFPLLQKLTIENCKYLKWDLGMLSAFPLLKELYVITNNRLTGNIRSLRVLKDTLETLTIASCTNVEGNLMDVVDFPLLKELNLYNTAVKGDVRDIGENDFSNLEKLRFPFGVVGGYRYKLQRVADVPSVVNAYYRLAKREKSLSEYDYSYYYWWLSDQSPDYYAVHEEALYPPHCISFVEVGSRLGWRWATRRDPKIDHDGLGIEYHSCEINWLDPEPDRENDDYEAYVEELASIQEEITVYRGYYQPPTEEEYRRLCREHADN